MSISANTKKNLQQVYLKAPLPFSKWLYMLGRSSLFPDYRRPYFEMAFRRVAEMQLPGDYLEFGVYQGSSMVLAAHSAAKYGLNSMRFFAFDSFQGLPEAEGKVFNSGQFACSEQTFTRMVAKAGVPIDKLVKVKGWYSDSLTNDVKVRTRLKQVAVVHIDCDLYSSTRDVLAFIQDLVQVGTIVIFDDWSIFRDEQHPEEFGEPKAFNEWTLRGCFEDFYEFRWTKAFVMNSPEIR